MAALHSALTCSINVDVQSLNIDIRLPLASMARNDAPQADQARDDTAAGNTEEKCGNVGEMAGTDGRQRDMVSTKGSVFFRGTHISQVMYDADGHSTMALGIQDNIRSQQDVVSVTDSMYFIDVEMSQVIYDADQLSKTPKTEYSRFHPYNASDRALYHARVKEGGAFDCVPAVVKQATLARM